jgi:hypothetical protein
MHFASHVVMEGTGGVEKEEETTDFMQHAPSEIA